MRVRHCGKQRGRMQWHNGNSLTWQGTQVIAMFLTFLLYFCMQMEKNELNVFAFQTHTSQAL